MKKTSILLLVVSAFLLILCQSKQSFFTYKELDKAHGKNLIADLDQDGRNDIIRIGGQAESVMLYHSNTDGTFESKPLITGYKMRGDRITAFDIDADGDMDLVAGINVNDSLYITWMRNPLKGESGSAWQVIRIGYQGTEKDGGTAYTKDAAVADFNKDGKPDVATRTNKLTRIFLQRSPEEWAAAIELPHVSHEGMDVADIDSDGDPDIVLNGFWFETPADPEKETFNHHIIDKKWFEQTEGSWRDNNSCIRVADMTGDGRPDILISHSEKPGFPISLYTAASPEAVKQDQWQELHVAKVYDFCQTLDAGDVDNDGDLDILAAKFERDHQGAQWRNQPPYPVSLFLNKDGKGGLWVEQQLSEKGMYAGSLGDVGSDGDLDVVGPRSYWTGPTDFYENTLK